MLDTKVKAELQPEVRKYRIEFDSLKRKALSTQEEAKYKEQKDFLFGVKEDKVEEKSMDVIRRQNEALQHALRIGYETDNLANDTTRQLRDQNIKATQTRTKTQELKEAIDESDSIVTRMLKREQCLIF